MTVQSGGDDETRTVQIGPWGGRYTEIRSGLDEGQAVLVSRAG